MVDILKNKTLSDYVFASKYAKYDKTLRRRETYEECVDRYLSTFTTAPQGKHSMPPSIVAEVREALVSRKISGSQRGLQFGGEAILRKNERAYNCSSSFCDRPAFFKEAMYLLLCGCGVGFSVSKEHVNKLPRLCKPAPISYNYVVEDSIEGWADAADALLSCFFNGTALPRFDYSLIRPAGSPISHGGKAPGADGLADALLRVRTLLFKLTDYGATQLRPIDCFDIVMHLSNAVLSGGIRRSACLTAFDLDDEEMLVSKTGDWFTENPQRARANISAIILPHHTQREFNAVFSSTKQFGEPGFLFLASNKYITNPCAEILMCPLLIRDASGKVVQQYTLDMLENQEAYKLKGYSFASGWSMCNLSTINCAAITPGQLIRYARLATILGTYQAALTKFPYLGADTEEIVRREALLGVSLTGVYSNPGFLNNEVLRLAADACVRTNKYHAEELGISPASRITCVKPEGTASLTLGVVSAGLHPYHAEKYIRRVQANKDEPLYKYVEKHCPTACEPSVWGNADLRVISFAC